MSHLILSFRRTSGLFIATLACMLATNLSAQPATDAFLEKILRQHPDWFWDILKNPGAHGVQILYTKIDRSRKNEPRFTTYRYNVDRSQYFYCLLYTSRCV